MARIASLSIVWAFVSPNQMRAHNELSTYCLLLTIVSYEIINSVRSLVFTWGNTATTPKRYECGDQRGTRETNDDGVNKRRRIERITSFRNADNSMHRKDTREILFC